MDQVLSITKSDHLRESLERYFWYVRKLDISTCTQPEPPSPDNTEISLDQWVLRVFEDMSFWIERTVGNSKPPSGSLDTIIFVELADPDLNSIKALNPLERKQLKQSRAWSTVVSMLILAFPEVHWVYLTPYSAPSSFYEKAHFFTEVSSLSDCLDLHDAGYTPLFDPAAQRRMIRKKMRTVDEGAAAGRVPCRPEEAVAIDDESDYSYFNAYTAYRFGYRGWTVTSWAMMEQLFKKSTRWTDIDNGGFLQEAMSRLVVNVPIDHNHLHIPERNKEIKNPECVKGKNLETYDDVKDSKSKNYWQTGSVDAEMILEDLYCKFPDRPNDRHLSLLSERDENLRGLTADGIQKRFVITVGHQRHRRGKQRQRENEQYLRKWRNRAGPHQGRRVAKIIQKPLGGMFDLWGKIGEWRRSLWENSGEPKTAENFEWPPNHERGSSGDHSAPGRLLVIADRLIDRSKAVLQEVRSVSDATYAATLALEAKELLADRTPTTSLEALSLQHQAEVIAESRFHGIEFNLDVRNRFEEIKREVEAIGRWFSGRRRKRVTLNARLTIIEDLAREFSELDQFEEERKCRAEARRLYFDFWAHQSPWRRPLIPALKYLGFSLSSMPAFLGLVVFWILLFGLVYYLLGPSMHGGITKGFWSAMSSSTEFFFTLSHSDPYWAEAESQSLWNFVLIIQSVVSLSHIGLLVSHLYLVISRR